MKTSKASAVWKGNLKEGTGIMHVDSLSDSFAYNFASRFANGKNTNPEELIAAAHSGCFSMALANMLSENGYEVNSIKTDAEVKINEVEGAFKITDSTLYVSADINDIDEEEFTKYVDEAKDGCPVSQALSSVKINLHAQLIEQQKV